MTHTLAPVARHLILISLSLVAACGGIDASSEQFDMNVEPDKVAAATDQANAHCRALGKEARITELRTGPVEGGIRKVFRVQCVAPGR